MGKADNARVTNQKIIARDQNDKDADAGCDFEAADILKQERRKQKGCSDGQDDQFNKCFTLGHSCLTSLPVQGRLAAKGE